MKIEAITVCVNYSDFLAATLPINRRQFDHILVITDLSDKDTQQVCRREKVECLSMPLVAAGAGVFSKSRAINCGLLHLGADRSIAGWMCVLDADIVLPLYFRAMIERMWQHLDDGCVYGIDRLMCRSYESWCKYIDRLRHPDSHFVTAEDFPVGKRYSYFGEGGWAPMGYFQLWQPQGSKIRSYSENNDMSLSDLKFAQQWPRSKRVLLPEIVAVHLESEPAAFGTNWKGRKTLPFGPKAQGMAI